MTFLLRMVFGYRIFSYENSTFHFVSSLGCSCSPSHNPKCGHNTPGAVATWFRAASTVAAPQGRTPRVGFDAWDLKLRKKRFWHIHVTISSWWFQRFFIFTLNLGEMIQFDEHFWDGFVQPPTSLPTFYHAAPNVW